MTEKPASPVLKYVIYPAVAVVLASLVIWGATTNIHQETRLQLLEQQIMLHEQRLNNIVAVFREAILSADEKNTSRIIGVLEANERLLQKISILLEKPKYDTPKDNRQ